MVVGGVLAACGSAKTVQAGAMIVAIDSDVSLPKDIDIVRVEVLQGGQGGTLVWGNNYSVPADQHLPATLAIQSGSGNNTVDIRIIGVHGSQVKVLREAVTTVPTDRQVTLRMPVAWLCYGSAMQVGNDVQSTCPSGQTCVSGECKTNVVQSQTLAVFKPADIFGGADAPGNSGTCFDTVACYSQGFVPQIDMTNCTVPTPKGGVGINFGLVTSAGQGVGICGTDSCYIPLDFSLEGWSVSGSTVQLPNAVCDRLKSGNVLSVVATTSCETKTPSIPTCGAWSSVQSMPGTVDASAPEGAIPVEAAPPEDAAPEAEAAVPEAAVEAPPGPLISCPNIWVGIDTSACDPRNPYVGCPAGQACAIVSPNAVGCVPSNLAAVDAGNGKQGWPCAANPGCYDGTICNSKQVCGTFCCNNADCAALGGSGLLCHYYQVAVDAGASDGSATGDAAAPGTYGVCE